MVLCVVFKARGTDHRKKGLSAKFFVFCLFYNDQHERSSYLWRHKSFLYCRTSQFVTFFWVTVFHLQNHNRGNGLATRPVFSAEIGAKPVENPIFFVMVMVIHDGGVAPAKTDENVRFWTKMDQMDSSCHWILDKTTGGLKFSGLGLDRTKLGPDSAPGQIWDQFLKSFEDKNSEKTCISVQHR